MAKEESKAIDRMFKVNEIGSIHDAVLFLRIEPVDKDTYTVMLEVKSGMEGQTFHERLKKAEIIRIDDGLTHQLERFADCQHRKSGVRKLGIGGSLLKQLELVKNIGTKIYQTFLPGDIGRIFEHLFSLLNRQKLRQLLLVISSPVPAVLNVPFEMMRKDEQEDPFSLQRDSFLLAHTIEASLEGFELQGIGSLAPPLRMLFVSALPVDLPEDDRLIEIEREQELLIEAVGDLISEQKVVVEFLEIASLEEIDRALSKGAHNIVHVSGHGAHLDVSDQPVGVLFLEDEAGNKVEVRGSELAERLNKHGSVKLVVLSACETARAEEFGTAGALIKAGLPAVLAMHYPVSDSAATLFTSAFYEGLCRGDSLARCLFHARHQVYAHEQKAIKEALDQGETEPQPSEWMTPFLYLNRHIRGLIDYSRKTSDTHYFFQKPVSLVVGGKYVGRGFVGRHKEIIRLNQWFRQGERCVCIHGQGGTGKTTLAIRFADNFDSGAYKTVQWVGEVTEEQILDRLAKEAQSKLGAEIVDRIHSPDFSVQHKLDLLIDQHLSRRKLILLFDNFEENQMESKAQRIYQPEIHSPSLKDFLTHLCRRLPSPSFILFTTRYRFDQPEVQGLNLGEMRFSDTFKLINRFRHLVQLSLGQKRQVHQKLGGHPRVLELLEGLLKGEETTWPEVSSRLKEAAETEINRDLLLEMLWERLTPEKQHILHGAAVFRHLTPLPGLTAVTDLDEPTIRRALDRLNAVSLTYLEDDRCYVHRLTAGFIMNKMPTSDQKQAHLKAAQYFENLTDDKGTHNVNDLIESRWHYILAEEWNLVLKITWTLQEYLTLWGFPRLSLRFLTEIVQKPISDENRAKVVGQMGILLSEVCEYDSALTCHEQALAIFRRLNNQKEISQALHSIGIIYQNKGKYDPALKKYQRSLEIRKKIGYKKGVAESLHQIDMIYQYRGDYDAALTQYQQSLEITETIGDVAGMAISFDQMGNLYIEKEEYDTALKFSVQSFLKFSELDSPNRDIVRRNILDVRKKMKVRQFEAILKEMGVTADMLEE